MKLQKLLTTSILVVGCGGAQHVASVAEVANAPAPVTEPEGLYIESATLGPDGRATPYGVSGGDPIAQLDGPTLDPTYAFTPENPARVGGVEDDSDPESGEKSFLHALYGPEGQPLYFQRLGGCCAQEVGMLDAFAVTYPGLEGDALVLYLDAYHREPLHVPVGLRGGSAD